MACVCASPCRELRRGKPYFYSAKSMKVRIHEIAALANRKIGRFSRQYVVSCVMHRKHVFASNLCHFFPLDIYSALMSKFSVLSLTLIPSGEHIDLHIALWFEREAPKHRLRPLRVARTRACLNSIGV